MDDYDMAAAGLRKPLPTPPDFAALVRSATLAPSGHNTQPWRFAPRGAGAVIAPDFTRRTPVVDPDDHHLFVSLGCATENFLVAARASGRPGEATFTDTHDERIGIDLGNAPERQDALFQAIPLRQSARSIYDGRTIANEDLRRLEVAARIDGVSVRLITGRGQREAVLDHVISGNSLQMEDPAFVRELRSWIRFNPREALAMSDGLFSRCTGNPSLPTWFGRAMFGLIFNKSAENNKYAEQVRSSAGIAVFIGDKVDKDHWVRVGRAFQRFALQATALDLRTALINQPIEAPSVRAEFARWLGAPNARPDLVVRFGAGRPMPLSMRRAVGAVIDPASAA